MKIVNFVQHPKPILVGYKKSWKEVATFNIEIPVSGATLTWTGWTIRQVDELPLFLQAPLLYKPSIRKIEPVIKISGIPPSLFLRMIRSQIKSKYGIEIPEPAPQTAERKKFFNKKKKQFKREKKEPQNVDGSLPG